ncbi:hypothetical protein [endosymbiont GvMRE of Glomus versiforme]|uniref:hypothetical protein n=1 Tax=endosymbiont GvMRE of Glomus versiforme TaxID=2039283 RepID=UPI000EDF04A6|nr:hypothetical protein [endosymbiont GvMRE of Glomus versiforme]RHZ35338.1 hypothetical protein GvMRE_IIg154 [endosymbiont GvMRE of Glomus versiforme]
MVYENIIPKTETIAELKQEIPTYAEFLETYKVDQAVENSYWLENQSQQKGYGPCIDDKNCSCGYIKGKSISAYENKRDGVKWFTTGVGIDGSFPSEDIKWAEVGVRTSILTLEDSHASIRVGSGNLGVCVGNGNSMGLEANINLVETDLGPLNGSLGISANTGASIKDKSISLNAGGLGLTVGRKVAVNTPFVSVGIDFGYFFKK